jgi:hypothetical protein
VPDLDWIRHHILLFVVLTTESTTFWSQWGHLGQLLFFLTGSPPSIASFVAFFVTLPYAGMLLDAIPASEPAEAAASNCRLVKSLVSIFQPLSFAVTSKHDISPKITL